MNRKYALFIVCALFFCVIWIVIAIFGLEKTPIEDYNIQSDVFLFFQNEIKASNMESFLGNLTLNPSFAGTEQDQIIAEWVKDQWIQFGLDDVRIIPYNVLLSYPDEKIPNKIYLLDELNNIQFETKGKQIPFKIPEDNSDLIMNSANGTVEAELVFAHYGRVEDFQELESRGINCTGKIIMARMGKIYIGNIVRNAELRGATGLILYSDPEDDAPLGRGRIDPDTWYIPGMVIPRGSSTLHRGDPLTSEYPDTESAFQLNESEILLPKIVVQPIGYDEAEILLRHLTNKSSVPDGWQGELKADYRTGPGFQKPNWKIRMVVRTTNKLATIHNVIGMIQGSVEKDRYVILGTHKDTWKNGTVDASTGLVSLMELARVTGLLKTNNGWKPRRSILFCAWGGVKYGMDGSMEWIEQFRTILGQRAVVYMNTDDRVSENDVLAVRATPSLHNIIRNAAKLIPNSNADEVAAGRPTLYDSWRHWQPDTFDNREANIVGLGGGSGCHGFLYYVGISSMDFSLKRFNETIEEYPLQHTSYGTYHNVTQFIDPGDRGHVAVTLLRAELMRRMVDSPVLPFDLVHYARYLQKAYDNIQGNYGSVLQDHGISLEHFREAVDEVQNSTRKFMKSLENVNNYNPYELRKVNDRMMYFERYFIVAKGLSTTNYVNHIFLSPHPVDDKNATQFAPLVQCIRLALRGKSFMWTEVKKLLSLTVSILNQISSSLQDNFIQHH